MQALSAVTPLLAIVFLVAGCAAVAAPLPADTPAASAPPTAPPTANPATADRPAGILGTIVIAAAPGTTERATTCHPKSADLGVGVGKRISLLDADGIALASSALQPDDATHRNFWDPARDACLFTFGFGTVPDATSYTLRTSGDWPGVTVTRAELDRLGWRVEIVIP